MSSSQQTSLVKQPTLAQQPQQKKSSNTGMIIMIIVVALIAVTALILSIIPLIGGNEESGSNGDCPKDGCNIIAGNLSSTNFTTTNLNAKDITNKVNFKQGFTSDGTISFPSADYDNLEATQLSGTNITYTNASFSNLNITNAKFARGISEPGIYYSNNVTSTAGLRNITLTNTYSFYSVELTPSSDANINLIANGNAFTNGQSFILNCWSKPNTNTTSTVFNSTTFINLTRTVSSTVVNNVTTTYRILNTTDGTNNVPVNLLTRNPEETDVLSRNYYIHYFNNTFHLIKIGQSS